MTSVLRKIKLNPRKRKQIKVRSKIFGTSQKPRLSVFKSNKYIFAQLIDDNSGSTLLSVFSKDFSGKTKSEKAKESGKELARKSVEKGVKEAVFDRGGFLYTGIVKAVAEGAREGGLKF